jgi:propionyl-CoA synthetase
LSTNLSGREAYKKSLEDPVAFWNAAASAVTWENFVKHRSNKADDPLDTWFPGSSLNFCLNCVDIHVKEGRGEQTALIYDSPVTKTITSVTYKELLSRVEVCSAVMLQNMGVKKGDRIIIYMPNVIEAIVTMLACYRIGAVHSVVFGGFAPHELATRLRDCKPTAIVLSSCGIDGSKVIPYAPLVQRAIEIAENTSVQSVLVHQRLQHPVDASMMHALGAVGRVRQVLDWEDTMAKVACSHSTDDIKKLTAPVVVDASHPLFILYTSGTTGAPKGVVRDTGGYAVGLKYSLSVVNGTRPGDVFWGASDVGWIVGHYSYLGSLITGATSVVYEGKPVGTPDEGNFWRTIERHKVNLLFTAPTALRAIKKLDDQGEQSKKFDLSSLKSIFCSGEHLDPDTLRWAERVSGKPVLDAWWQTESGRYVPTPPSPLFSLLLAHPPNSSLRPFVSQPNDRPAGGVGRLQGKGQARLCLPRRSRLQFDDSRP